MRGRILHKPPRRLVTSAASFPSPKFSYLGKVRLAPVALAPFLFGARRDVRALAAGPKPRYLSSFGAFLRTKFG
jgi:hypothetical protein